MPVDCTLDRARFEQACHAFLTARGDKPAALFPLSQSRRGWRWNKHPAVPGLGYLAREQLLRCLRPSKDPFDSPRSDLDVLLEEIDNPEDEATVEVEKAPSALRSEPVIVSCSVAFSDTYQVPAFYFTAAHASTGVPLTLDELVRCTLFHRSGDASIEAASSYPFNTLPSAGHGARGLRDARGDLDAPLSLPFLTTVEHPATSQPCWSVHPCNTAPVLSEVLEDCGDREPLVYMETWMMIVGTLMDLRGE